MIVPRRHNVLMMCATREIMWVMVMLSVVGAVLAEGKDLLNSFLNLPIFLL